MSSIVQDLIQILPSYKSLTKQVYIIEVNHVL